jgi:hypothetical protein
VLIAPLSIQIRRAGVQIFFLVPEPLFIAVIAAMRTIPSIRESTRYWMMRFSANMTNDDWRLAAAAAVGAWVVSEAAASVVETLAR